MFIATKEFDKDPINDKKDNFLDCRSHLNQCHPEPVFLKLIKFILHENKSFHEFKIGRRCFFYNKALFK